MSEKLKPCPFCGRKAFVDDSGRYEDIIVVQCCECCSEGAIGETRKEAIKAWNKRVK